MTSLGKGPMQMDQYSRREAFKMASAAGLVGVAGLGGTLVADDKDSPDIAKAQASYKESEEYQLRLVDRLKKVVPGRQALTPKATEQLASQLATDADSPFDLEAALSVFYSLGSEDTETVLSLVRAKHTAESGDSKEVESTKASLRKAEGDIRLAVKALNQESLKRTKLPFHVSTLANAVPSLDGVISHKDILKYLGMTATGTTCPTDSYPRYVGWQSPWKLQVANTQSFRMRTEDPSCNINHGPFNKKITGWTSFAPACYGMVISNGWGGSLAANDKNLFVKWWTLLPFGFTPWHLFAVLMTRHA